MTLYADLLAAGLPVIEATEEGAVIMGPMTEAQGKTFTDILLQRYQPTTYADLNQWAIDKQALKDDYVTAISQLDAILAWTTPTNNQVMNGVKQIARILEGTLKLIKRMV